MKVYFKRFIAALLGCFGLAVIKRDTLLSLTQVDLTENVSDVALPSTEIIECGSPSDIASHDHPDGTSLLQHQISSKWFILDALEKQKKQATSLTCPLCDTKEKSDSFSVLISSCIFEGGNLLRHQCPNCDVIFGPNKMLQLSEAELSDEYKWHYQVFSEVDSTGLEKKAFYNLNPSKEGVYLNWGAGSWAKTIEELRGEGWNVYGFEPHASSANSNPFIISDKKQLNTMKFDGVFSNNVLEHFRYPIQELIEMREILKEGGRMSHATPCYEYLYEYTRFHLFFFLGRSRELLATKASLHIEEFLVEGEFMNMVFKKV